MTQDEVIEMAKLAGWEMDDSCVLEPEVIWYISQGQLEAFAKLVAEHEREACAKLCEQMWHEWLDSTEENEPNKPDAEDCYRAIRARGQA